MQLLIEYDNGGATSDIPRLPIGICIPTMTPELLFHVLDNIEQCIPQPETVLVINNSFKQLYTRSRFGFHLVIAHGPNYTNLDYNPSVNAAIDYFRDIYRTPLPAIGFFNDDIDVSRNIFNVLYEGLAFLPQALAISPATFRFQDLFDRFQKGEDFRTPAPPYKFRRKPGSWCCLFKKGALDLIPPIPDHLFKRYCGDMYQLYRIHEMNGHWWCDPRAQCFHHRSLTTNKLGVDAAHGINRAERKEYLRWKVEHTDVLPHIF